MLYLVEDVDKLHQPAVIKKIANFAWDAEQIRIIPGKEEIVIDFGEPLLKAALDRLVRLLNKRVRPVEEEPHNGWQVICTHAAPED